jgi:predicted transcriptional regulator
MYTIEHLSVIIMSTTMTVRLEDEIKSRLDQLAESTKRSRSFLAAEAIREWQIGEIIAGIQEADRGEFASEAEVKAFFDGWRGRAD